MTEEHGSGAKSHGACIPLWPKVKRLFTYSPFSIVSFNSLGYTLELPVMYGIVQNLGAFLLKHRHSAVECQRVCICHFLAVAVSLRKQNGNPEREGTS